jgi:hypothetical protein
MRPLSAALVVFIGSTALAQSPEAVRQEIEASYVKALDSMRRAKSLEDLDELNRSFDTQDWQSIVPGQQPRGWPELRNYGFEGLWAPFQSAALIIDIPTHRRHRRPYRTPAARRNEGGCRADSAERDLEAYRGRMEAPDPSKISGWRDA